ncbi:O-methyltransferase-domain-containing protein [Lyophyllum atratum]|nr:O-methyltransferase-domain-containing protein [Lyophyllum atratum]
MAGRAAIETLLKLITSSAQDALGQYESYGQEPPLLSSTVSHPLDTANDTLALRKAIRVLEGACEQLCTALAPPVHTIVNRGQNLDWICLLVAIEARIADSLYGKDEGMHVEEISKSVGIESGKLARILRLLATKHVFTEVEPEIFANNRLSLVLQSSSNVSYLTYCHTTLGPKAASVFYDNLTNKDYATSYDPGKSPFMQAVQDEGIRGSFFDWLKAHPEKRATFGRAMVGLGQVMSSLSVLHHFPWSEISTVCDVGSGVGAFSLPLARAYPQLRISLFDLPETIEQAVELWSQEYPQALKEPIQVNLIGGDFFQQVDVMEQDVYYLRNIIHNWPDAQAQQILGKVREAMGRDSRLLIHDHVLPHINQTELEAAEMEVAPLPLLPNYGAGAVRTYYQDLTMLFTYNSKERTLDESVALASTVGLRLQKVWDLAETSLLEFRLIECD